MTRRDREHARLLIDGAAFEVVSLSGREAVFELFRYEVDCAIGNQDTEPRKLAGAPATIEIEDAFGNVRRVHGVVAEAEHRVWDRGHAGLFVVIRPAAWLLTLGRCSRVFQDKTTPDIVREVIAGAPVDTRWALAASYSQRVYTAEYREDDFTFAKRLLEEEGIHYWFDHEGERSVMVFADDSTRAPDLAGGALVPFSHGTGMTRDHESIVALGPFARVAPSRFSVASFNPAKPTLAVKGTTGAGPLEIYDARGAGPDSPDECSRQARIGAEAAASGATGVSGMTSSARLVPGMIVEITGHPLGSLDGRWLVTESVILVEQRRKGDTAGNTESAFTCRFQALAAEIPFRPSRTTPRARQPGLGIGNVVGPAGSEVHPDATGRVRVQYHWDREGKRDERAGKWMRVAQRGTADSMQFPRVGWNVLTLHEEGSAHAPSVLSRVHDGEHPPEYALPANKTRVVWKTATVPGGGSHNEIRYEDKAGSEEMFWNASRDMESLVQNDRWEEVSRDVSRTVGNDHAITITRDYTDVVKGDQRVAIGNDESIDVGGSEEKTVAGNETMVIGGKRSLTVGGKFLDQVAETRKLTVGAAQIDATLGFVSSTAKDTSVLVGGAMIRATAESMAESGGWVSVQTIGGAKLELSSKERATSVKKNMVETVGGAMMLTTAKTFKDHAEKTSVWTVGAMTSFAAPSVMIEATEKLTIKVGGSSITMTPDDITIDAPNFDLTQASAVVVNTPKESHD